MSRDDGTRLTARGGPRSSIVGRDAELSLLGALLMPRQVPVVSITGPGGAGKTRLAAEALRTFGDRYPGGTAAVMLATIDRAEAVAPEVQRALDGGRGDTPGSWAALAEVIGGRDVLLVLDNLEQIPSLAPPLATLTTRCPGLTVLATSRRPLGIPGEHVLPIRGLTVTEPTAAGDAGGPVASPAVQLFCERVRAVDARFAPSADDLAAITRVCELADGLPLAIELAAARTRLVPVTNLLALLTSGDWSTLDLPNADTTAPSRHHTLREAIAWNERLLSPVARTALRRLSVFRQGWTFEGAQAVCEPTAGDRAADAKTDADDTADDVAAGMSDTTDAISELVDLGLVEPTATSAAGPDGSTGSDGKDIPAGSDHTTGSGDSVEPPRFDMLSTVQAFAADALAAADETAAAERRHAEHYLTWLTSEAPRFESPAQSACFRRVDTELANIRAALQWLVDAERVADAVAAAVALGPYWLDRFRLAEGQRWLGAADALDPDTPLAASATVWRCRLAFEAQPSGSNDAPVTELADVMAHARGRLAAQGEVDHVRASVQLAHVLTMLDRHDDAEGIVHDVRDECTRLRPASRRRWWEAEVAYQHGLIGRGRHDTAAMRRHADEAAALAQQSGNERLWVRARQLALPTDWTAEEAIEAHLELIELCDRVNDERGAIASRVFAATILSHRGDRAAAAGQALQGLRRSRQTGYWYGLGFMTMLSVAEAHHAGRHRDATRVAGGLADHLDMLFRNMPAAFVDGYRAHLAALRQRLGHDEFERVWARGRAAGWHATINAAEQLARSLAAPGTDATTPASATAGASRDVSLTAREVEVLRMLTTGGSNKEIASALFMSPKTVMHHTTRIYRKLGVRGRAEAVAHALRHLPAVVGEP